MNDKNHETRAAAAPGDSDMIMIRRSELELPSELPLIGIEGLVLFPFMIAPIILTQDDEKVLIDEVLRGNRLLGVFLKKDLSQAAGFDNFHDVGTLAIVLKMLRMPDGAVRLLLHGIDRIRVAEPGSTEPFLSAQVERLVPTIVESRTIDAMVLSIKRLMSRVIEMGHLPEDLDAAVREMSDAGKLADLAVSHLSTDLYERQKVLGLVELEDRLREILEILTREVDLLQLGSEIQTKVSSGMEKNQRNYVLREQLKTIKKELGEDESQNPEIAELAQTIEETEIPEYAREAARKELGRLEAMHPSAPEYTVSRNYLDWILSLPWAKDTDDNIDIKQAREVLDQDHYGLEDVKERILEHLAVIQLRKTVRGPILCFVGPPGVGKTSLGQSIARAMGRKFYRMSLGGMRDEAEIRGHRRTYVGSLPGRLIKGIRDCGTRNPLIMLDEVDKIGADFRGDPASALLEVLDPQQNNSFTDHYLDMPFDLSSVMFITTANLLDPIPSPLLDRMEVLHLSGYTTREKLEIAKRYLVPRSYENTGVSAQNVAFRDDGILEIIESYTREAGVRNLERELGSICRKVAKRIALGQAQGTLSVDPERVREMLGPRRVFQEMAERAGQVGVATGMAWTQAGGTILFIEASAVPGNGAMRLTGQLGEVMKESALAAMNYLHANAERFEIPESAFSTQDFHIHVPAGATPKDGPSAGITIACALASLLSHCPLKESLAMTGEITLKGNVLAVGGIKEKVLAAHRAGIREIILPERCREGLQKDVPRETLDAIRFHYANHISQVIRHAFPQDVFAGEPDIPAARPGSAALRLPTQAADSKPRGPLDIKPEEPKAKPAPAHPKRPTHAVAERRKQRDARPSAETPEVRAPKPEEEKKPLETPPREIEKKPPEPAPEKEPIAAAPSDAGAPSAEEDRTDGAARRPRRRRRGRRGSGGSRQNVEQRTPREAADRPSAEIESQPQAQPTPKPAMPKAPERQPQRHAPQSARSGEAKRPPHATSQSAGAEEPLPSAERSFQKKETQQPSEPPVAAAPPPAPDEAPKKKTTRKKTTTATGKTAAKKTAAKKTTAKKTAVKKTAAKKTTEKKTAAKKTTAKRTTAKKVTAAKKTTIKPKPES